MAERNPRLTRGRYLVCQQNDGRSSFLAAGQCISAVCFAVPVYDRLFSLQTFFMQGMFGKTNIPSSTFSAKNEETLFFKL